MGLGKTIQAIAALRILVRHGKVESALIVAPVGVLLQWRQQLRADSDVSRPPIPI
jgi:SNF2 family DNA or RNA helicase